MALTSVVEACNNFLLALLAPPFHVAAGVNGWVHSERRGPRRPETCRSPKQCATFHELDGAFRQILVRWTRCTRHVYRTRASPSMSLTSVVEACNNFHLALLASPIHVAVGVNGWVYSKTRSGIQGLGSRPRSRGGVVTANIQGYLAQKKHPLLGPYGRPIPQALWRS